MKKWFAIILVSLILLFYVPNAFSYTLTLYSDPEPVAATMDPSGEWCLLLPEGEVGKRYEVTFYTNSKHGEMLHWRLEGEIPSGLGTSERDKVPTFTLSGIPREDGTFIFKISVYEEVLIDHAVTPIVEDEPSAAIRYMLIINPSPTPTSLEPIDYELTAEPNSLLIDLSPLATGKISSITGGPIKVTLRKTGGTSEPITLEQVGLPEGVDMWMDGKLIRSDTHVMMENRLLENEVTFDLTFDIGGGWRELAGPHGERKEYRIDLKASSISGVEKHTVLVLSFYYGLPRLEIVDIEPITQHGPDLVWNKQTTFKFKYLLESDSEMEVFVHLKLDMDEWLEVPSVWIDGEPVTRYIRPYKEEGRTAIFQEVVTLQPTPDGKAKTIYLFESLEGTLGKFLPTPHRKTVSVELEVDPYKYIKWDDRSVLTISKSFTAKYYCPSGKKELIKIVFFEHVGGGFWGGVRPQLEFSDSELWELHQKLQMKDPPPYSVYLSGIFPGNFLVSTRGYLWKGVIGWWDADTLGERAADEGYSRVIAITPPGALEHLEDAIGIVYHRCYGKYDQSYYTAFVDYDWALDGGRNLYFPIVAHELSHTYHYPDIYDDYRIVVDYDYVYFDEVRGGIISIHKSNIRIYGDVYEWDGGNRKRVATPTDISAYDIMDKMHADRSKYWAHASYDKVHRHFVGDWSDPPEGLVVSLILFKNGSVLERPFQKIYNHTFRFPSMDAVGNFSLILYNRRGEVFRNYPYNISFYYTADPIGSKPAEAIPFVTLVEWSDGLGRIELVDSRGKVWFRREVSEHTPILNVIYPSDGVTLTINRLYNITWEGSDADGDPLWYTVLIKREDDEVWTCLANRIQNRSILFTPSEEFMEGDYLLQMKATDGVNTAVKVIHFSVTKAGKVYVLSVKSNIGLKLSGSGTYNEGDVVKIEAPSEVPMTDLWGLLGGKYKFSYWKGMVYSKETTLMITIAGETTDLTLLAIYTPDYSTVYLSLGLLTVAVIIALSVLILRKRAPTKTP